MLVNVHLCLDLPHRTLNVPRRPGAGANESSLSNLFYPFPAPPFPPSYVRTLLGWPEALFKSIRLLPVMIYAI